MCTCIFIFRVSGQVVSATRLYSKYAKTSTICSNLLSDFLYMPGQRVVPDGVSKIALCISIILGCPAFSNSIPTPRSASQAIVHYTIASWSRHPYALMALAHRYRTGQNMPVSCEKAEAMYAIVASEGMMGFAYGLRMLVYGRYEYNSVAVGELHAGEFNLIHCGPGGQLYHCY